jgi:hypothetical protein
MSWVEFEPTIPAFKRTKTVHALDRAATVIGKLQITKWNYEQTPGPRQGLNIGQPEEKNMK